MADTKFTANNTSRATDGDGVRASRGEYNGDGAMSGPWKMKPITPAINPP
jgi:hypothetical protein